MFLCRPHLRCGNSFPHLDGTCWNHVQAPVAPLRTAFINWLVARCNESDEFRSVLLDSAARHLREQQCRSSAQRDVLAAKVRDLEVQERNLRKSIGVSEEIADEELTSLVSDLAAVTQQLRNARSQLSVQDSSDPIAQLAGDEILANLADVLEHLLQTSFEMAEVVRGFVPRCVIVPVQSWAGGQVYPRAKLLVRGNLQNREDLTELVVDLFDAPVHIGLMADALRLRRQTPQPTLKQIGAVLDTSYMTVKRALGYARLMEALGVTEPFRELCEKPAQAARWRHAS
jgi:hypothetical protein